MKPLASGRHAFYGRLLPERFARPGLNYGGEGGGTAVRTQAFGQVGGEAQLEPPRVVFRLQQQQIEHASEGLGGDGAVVPFFRAFVLSSTGRAQFVPDAGRIGVRDIRHCGAAAVAVGQHLGFDA